MCSVYSKMCEALKVEFEYLCTTWHLKVKVQMIFSRRTVVEIESNCPSLPTTIWQHLWQVSSDLFYILNDDMCWQWCIKVLDLDRRGMFLNSSSNSSSRSHSCSWWRRRCHLILLVMRLVVRWGYELTLSRNRRIGFNKIFQFRTRYLTCHILMTRHTIFPHIVSSL